MTINELFYLSAGNFGLVRARDRTRFRGEGALTSGTPTANSDREMVIALDGHLTGKCMREIADDLYGAERVAAEWTSESVLCARARRLLRKARAEAKVG